MNNNLDFLDDDMSSPSTWTVKKSQFVGDTLLHSKHIIPTDVFVAERVQEIYSLDFKLEIQSQEVRSLIRDVKKYFNDVSTLRYSEATGLSYYYTDDRADLIGKIDEVKRTRLVNVDYLIEYLDKIKRRMSISTTLNLDPQDTRTLERYNYLRNVKRFFSKKPFCMINQLFFWVK